MQLTTAATVLATLQTVLALDITLHLPHKPNPNSLPATTHATLSSLHTYHSAPLSTANTFIFHNVSAESYLLDIHCATDVFQPIRVDVGADWIQAWETFRGGDWGNKGEVLTVDENKNGIVARAIGGKSYYSERPAFSVLSILKNPMILMGLFSMVMFIGMPYLMDNMDPEMKAEFEARQAEGGPLSSVMGGGAQKSPLGNFDMAAYLAGSGKKEDGVKR